jgi:large subunit ribosomal protein L23
VKVANVNTLNRKGKRKRGRRSPVPAKLPDSKRAIVTLAEGEIEIFQAG